MIKKLYIHGGGFHADDVFCDAVLRVINGDLITERVITTDIDLTDIEHGIIMADIGGGEFDHHQKDAPLREDGIRHCAVTRLWKKFGSDCIRAVAHDVSDETVSAVSDRIYNGILKEIAALDNGEDGVLPNGITNICDLIDRFYPAWDSDEDPDTAFADAAVFAHGVLVREIKHAVSDHKAEKLVREAVQKMDNGIIVLDQYLPWEHTVVQDPDAKIVIYPSARKEINLRLVPVEEGSFTTRLDVPDAWKGKRNAAADACMHGMVFCHPTGFLMAFDDLESALSAAHSLV